MYQRIILTKYSVEDFAPLVGHIVGVSFAPLNPNRVGAGGPHFIGSSGGRLFFVYDAQGQLPPVLRKVVEAVPEMEVRSIFMAIYSESEFSDEVNIERDSEYDSNQIMLNFSDDEGALVLVSLDDIPRRGERQIKAHYETLKASINYQTGVRLIKPVIKDVVLDLSKLLPI